jgi:hypothetical protein
MQITKILVCGLFRVLVGPIIPVACFWICICWFLNSQRDPQPQVICLVRKLTLLGHSTIKDRLSEILKVELRNYSFRFQICVLQYCSRATCLRLLLIDLIFYFPFELFVSLVFWTSCFSIVFWSFFSCWAFTRQGKIFK